MTAAVMFDCDGVLVDSETLIAELLVEIANDRGADLTVADGLRMFQGIPLSLCAERISGHLGRDVARDVVAEYRWRSREVFRRRLTPMDGVEEVILSLEVPFCVVSNTAREQLLFILEVIGLLKYFSGHVYSAADLSRWKPEPDVYLYAAKGLGVDPRQCIAIEDTVTGVRSASLAGMRVIGFDDPELRHYGATWTCQKMSEVKALVHSLTRSQAIGDVLIGKGRKR